MKKLDLRLSFLATTLLTVYGCASAPPPHNNNAEPDKAIITSSRSTDEHSQSSDFRKAKKSTLTLKSYDEDQKAVGQGSGFYIGNGHIVTNAHVVAGAAFVEFYDADGKRVGGAAYTLYADTTADIAILPAPELPVPALSGAASPAVDGDHIWAVGSPLGYSDTLSDGIISGSRVIDGQSLLQITAPISPGSSGGPVVNRMGAVIGLVVGQVKAGQNLNFAVPYATVEQALSTVLKRQPFPPAKQELTKDELQAKALYHGLVTSPTIATGKRYTGYLDPGSRKDLAKADYSQFNIPDGQHVYITVSSSEFDPKIALASKANIGTDDAFFVTDDDSGPGNAAHLDGTVPEPGIYYLIVSSAQNRGGTYELDLTAPRRHANSERGKRWIRVGKSKNVVIYADKKSVSFQGQTVIAWFKIQYEVPQSNAGDRFNSKIERFEFDCARQRMHLLAIVLYSDGEVVNSYESNPNNSAWTAIVPGSRGEAMANTFCPD